MAKDISTVGASITFRGARNFTITEFSDEGTPFDAPDVDVSTNAKNLNGIMISSRTPSVYPFSVTVIPGSVADQKLQSLLQESSLQPGAKAGTTSKLYCDVDISIPKIVDVGSTTAAGDAIIGGARKYSFTNARIKSGPTGPSTSAEGRQSARTYSFEAEGFSAI